VKSRIYIGVDDTDILGESPGTGRIARGLAQNLEKIGLGESLGVSRHQLLVDPRIRYTSHNSSLCITMEAAAEFTEFIAPCVDYVKAHHKNGHGPGLCLCPRHAINRDIVEFGWRATREVLTKNDAIKVALEQNLILKELGGSGEGIIGALAAVALRADGNQGRFIELRGIQEINGKMTVSDLLARTSIASVRDAAGHFLPLGELIESYDCISPSLSEGEPVLLVRPIITQDGQHVWEPIGEDI
jgi:hypothetical protein